MPSSASGVDLLKRSRDEEREREAARAAALEARDHALAAWRYQLEVLTGHFTCFESLRDGYIAEQSPEAREQLIEALMEDVKLYTRAFAYAAERGDPAGLEGLTEPLTAALVRVFERATPENADEITELTQAITEICFYDHLGLKDEYLARQAPLTQALANVIECHPPAPDYADAPEGPVITAIRMLRIARERSITGGPLASWVAALVRRAQAGRLSEREAEALRAACVARDPTGLGAFADIRPLIGF